MKFCCSICKEIYFDGDLEVFVNGGLLKAANAHRATHSWFRIWLDSLNSKYHHWRIKRAFRGTKWAVR